MTSIRYQERAHAIFEQFGLQPTYLVDYPVANQPDGYLPLVDLLDDGKCEIGAHLHPWVNPPHDETVSNRNSYAGNLPAKLELEKLRILTESISENFGMRPVVYRAGRYGVGPNTADALEELGYRLDTSVVPGTDFSREDGPNFIDRGITPYWFGGKRRLLEIPLTVAFTGRVHTVGPHVYRAVTGTLGKRLRLPGVMARTGLLERIRLSPEGIDHEEHRRLTQALLERGHKIFCFTYHSPSLEPGNTPYVRTAAELDQFLDKFRRYFDYFLGELGGQPATLTEMYGLLADNSETPRS